MYTDTILEFIISIVFETSSRLQVRYIPRGLRPCTYTCISGLKPPFSVFILYILVQSTDACFAVLTAHQCSLEQSEWVSPITLAHAIVSGYRMWDSTDNDNIQTAWSARGPECSNIHKGSERCIVANRCPRQLHRMLNNTEVKERT